MRRRAAILVVLLLAVVAGCAGGVDPERLNETATYEWETETTAKVNITGGDYNAVYRVDDNESLEIYRLDDLDNERSVPVEALRFRYSNGTVVGPEALTVEEENARVVVTPPGEGRIAYTGPTRPKHFSTPALVAGTYDVVLPSGMDIGVPVLGSISPGGATRTVGDEGRTHLRWSDLDRGQNIELQYYLKRDLYIFGGLIGGLALLAAAGVVYFRYRLRELARRRETTDFED